MVADTVPHPHTRRGRAAYIELQRREEQAYAMAMGLPALEASCDRCAASFRGPTSDANASLAQFELGHFVETGCRGRVYGGLPPATEQPDPRDAKIMELYNLDVAAWAEFYDGDREAVRLAFGLAPDSPLPPSPQFTRLGEVSRLRLDLDMQRQSVRDLTRRLGESQAIVRLVLSGAAAVIVFILTRLALIAHAGIAP